MTENGVKGSEMGGRGGEARLVVTPSKYISIRAVATSYFLMTIITGEKPSWSFRVKSTWGQLRKTFSKADLEFILHLVTHELLQLSLWPGELPLNVLQGSGQPAVEFLGESDSTH